MKTSLSFLFVVLLVGCVKSKPDEAEAGAAKTPPPVASPAASSTAFSEAQCESLLVDAERQLSTERARAPADCKKDDECQLIETSACIPACNDRAMAKKGFATYTKAREQLRQSSCKLWNDAECARTTPKPKPDCPEMKAVCKAGRCDAAPK